MAKQRSRIKGDFGFRKLIKRLPESVRNEMADVLGDAGQRLLASIRADVPVKSGALRNALSSKLLRASLRLRVGLVGKRPNSQFFYGRIIEFGRKAQTVTITKGKRRGAQLRVRAMAPRKFVFKGRVEVRAGIQEELRSFWSNALQDASQGVGND